VINMSQHAKVSLLLAAVLIPLPRVAAAQQTDLVSDALHYVLDQLELRQMKGTDTVGIAQMPLNICELDRYSSLLSPSARMLSLRIYRLGRTLRTPLPVCFEPQSWAPGPLMSNVLKVNQDIVRLSPRSRELRTYSFYSRVETEQVARNRAGVTVAALRPYILQAGDNIFSQKLDPACARRVILTATGVVPLCGDSLER
jgi:hypothetical protein